MVKPPTVHAESTPDEAVSDSDADQGSEIKDSPLVETTDSPEATDESKPEPESEPPAAAVVEEAPPPDEEVEDIQVTYKADCRSSKCKYYQSKLEECTTRVNSKKETAESCEEELFDFVHCVDHCVAEKLFDRLK